MAIATDVLIEPVGEGLFAKSGDLDVRAGKILTFEKKRFAAGGGQRKG